MFALLNLYTGAAIETLTRWMNEPLEHHALNCDLCLMYEGPTTGAIVFLRNSIPILNPTVSVQSEKCVAMLHTAVVVAESLDASLRRLEQFKAEPLTLDAFRIAQFQAYVSLHRAARPLRTYLGGQSAAGDQIDADLSEQRSAAEAAA